MTTQQSPLVEAYLEDLDRALAGIDPAERADVVASIREHVDESLGEAPTSQDVQDVLRRLGPVERIAREADVVGPAILGPSGVGDLPGSGHAARSGPVLLALAALSLALIPVVPVAAIALALAVGIAALLGARRADGPTGLLRAAAALAALTVLLTALAAASLLSVRTEVSIEAPIEVVSPGGG